MIPLYPFSLPKETFDLAKKKYAEYFKFRIWDSKDALVFNGALQNPLARKNIEKSIYKDILACLANKLPELGHEFEQHYISAEIVQVVRDCLYTAAKERKEKKDGAGFIRVLKQMIDYFPTCVVMLYAVRKKLEMIERGQANKVKRVKEYREAYRKYKEFLERVVVSYGNDFVPIATVKNIQGQCYE